MRSIKDLEKGVVVTATILLMAMPVWAGNGKGSGAGHGSGTRTQSRSRDGSCQDAVEKQQDRQFVTADLSKLFLKQQLHDPDQMRDGSCDDFIEQQKDSNLLARDTIRDYIWLKKQLKDESCLEDA
ncbi:MAG: hypothetical protein PHI97_06370 [Desulfobulbus sp.]|nr:hypothetical protein [Desulfobulbus sp.]